MGELLYNVIAVYIIIVLIRISAKFEAHYNLLAVSRYISTIFSQQVSISRYSRLKQYVDLIGCSFTLFQTVQRHGVYIAAYDMQLLLLLYYLVPICRKFTLIYRQLGNNHLIQLLLYVFFIHLKVEIMSATLGSRT